MKAIINGRIVTPESVVEGKVLLYDREILGFADNADHAQEVIDAEGQYVIPGLVDIHIHGYLGADASDGDYEGIRTMAYGVAKNGVTSFLPTTMTVSYDTLETAFEQIRRGMTESMSDEWNGAQILGVNAEGPFINRGKKGAQAEEHVRPGDASFLKKHADVIRLFTIAPEVGDNLDCIREMAQDGRMRISIGHTAATYDQAKTAFDAGARHVTHLFNAQTGLAHREPGVVGAALTDERVACELIADTFHVHKGLFELVAKSKGDNLVLITDCTRAGGLADGEYTLGGQPIYVQGIECRLADGTIAGSVLKLNEAVRNILDNTSLSVPEAVRLASLNPAKCIGAGATKGSIETGKDADLAIVDARMNVLKTILGGRVIHS